MKLIKKINSLSRGKQTIIFIIIAAVLLLLRVGTSRDKYFAPEDVMYACERGLHYGPSEKVLKTEIQGKNALVIGKCEGGLSSVRATKGMFFWKLGYDGDGTVIEGLCSTDTIEAWYDEEFNLLYGRSMIDGVKTVTVVMGEDGKELFGMKMDVDKDGFFFGTPQNYERQEDEWPYTIYISGSDKDGNIIYEESLLGEEIFDSDGSLIYSSFRETSGAE